MNFLYRKMLRYPKSYFIALLLLGFVAFSPAYPGQTRFYFQLLFFIVTMFFFIKIYMKLVSSDFLHYEKVQASAAYIQNNIRNSFLVSSLWLLILPIIGLSFYDDTLIKFISLLFIACLCFFTACRRMSFKAHVSMERSVYILLKNLFFAGIVSYLPFFIVLFLFI